LSYSPNLVDKRLKGLAKKITDNPIRRVEDAVAMVFTILVYQNEPASLFPKLCAE